MGLLKKIIQNLSSNFSVFIIGKKREFLVNWASMLSGKIILGKVIKEQILTSHIGRPFDLGNTIIHFVENNVKAEYRFHKIFPTRVFRGKRYIGTNYSAFVQKKKYRGKKIDTDKKNFKMIEKKIFIKKLEVIKILQILLI